MSHLAEPVSPSDSTPLPPALHDAITTAAAELRAEADRAGCDPAVARLLLEIADGLAVQGAWTAVDRLVHDLVTNVLTDALAPDDAGRTARLAARSFAVRIIARHDPLWPGAGPRLGCAYGYDSLMAVVRCSAMATAA